MECRGSKVRQRHVPIRDPRSAIRDPPSDDKKKPATRRSAFPEGKKKRKNERKNIVNRYWRWMAESPRLPYFRPKRNCLLFLARESALLEDEESSIACSGTGTSSGLKTLPAPPRPACWAPLLDRRTTLHVHC